MATENTPAVATAKVVKPKTAVSSLTLGNADDALTLATELQKFVRDNKLTSTIQGKQFPNVEAWQFAGSLLGLSPLLENIEDKSTADEIKWAATMQLINIRTGAVVGRGYATCSNKESTKRSFADYAICSMAQTRAVGKAYRLSLGWLMKAAGYEATPAEEMQEAEVVSTRPTQPAAPVASAPASATPTAPVAVDENGEVIAKALVLDLLRSAESHAQLETIWKEEVKGVWELDQDVLAAAKETRSRLNQELQAAA
ncbi:hypothetical protein [Hymenobacter sp. GOD-10R]|uniref:hypothetical protein n=1 Tax=Hymenobacter sp. GOD-10R TaxID=3093922 RepID=UPI002D784005|nr:hypothetical protein [Hymenobacter sp. GOD-10R]WRQ26699.1 hypothetical protein SD425_16625 [Hymenobacter sp. GOD-10R]